MMHESISCRRSIGRLISSISELLAMSSIIIHRFMTLSFTLDFFVDIIVTRNILNTLVSKIKISSPSLIVP